MRDYRFRVYFGSEEDCQNHFKRLRDERGIVCGKCGSTGHYWQECRLSYECKKCGHRTSLRSGTVMENSNLPFQVWYKAIFLLCLTKDKIPAQRIQKLVGWKRYEPILMMRHKLDGFVKKLKVSQTLEGVIKNSTLKFEMNANAIENRAGETYEENKRIKYQPTIVKSNLPNYEFYFVADVIDGNTEFDNDSFLDVTDYVRFYPTQTNTWGNNKQLRRPFRTIELIVNNKRMPPHNGRIQKKYLPLYFDEFTKKLNASYFESWGSSHNNFVRLLKQATISYD